MVPIEHEAPDRVVGTMDVIRISPARQQARRGSAVAGYEKVGNPSSRASGAAITAR